MGAFFSSTDDNNDKNGIYYSLVVGTLDKAPTIAMRFNLHEHKVKCELSDIFITPEPVAPTVPEEWLNQVEVRASAPYKGRQVYKKGPDKDDGDMGNLHELGMGGCYGFSPEDYAGHPGFKGYPNTGSLWSDKANLPVPKNLTLNRETGEYEELEAVQPGLAKMVEDAEQHLANLDQETRRSLWPSKTSAEAEETNAATTKKETQSESTDEEAPLRNGQFEYYVEKYGMEKAEAIDAIELELCELDECDEALLCIISQAYNMMSSVGKEAIQTFGIS